MKRELAINAIFQGNTLHEIRGDANILISSISHDSRQVTPGCLFICLKGDKHDGHKYAVDAIRKGAVALVVNQGGLDEAGVDVGDIPLIVVPDTRVALPQIACVFYDNPAQKLMMVGVTGTNGKTTTMRLVAHILRSTGLRVGTIGTLGAEIDGEAMESEHTTPEADQLQELLGRMLELGAQAVVMEVSSHALDQHRTAGIPFNVAIFTNLTQDHLDYHGTMENYFDAKARLFSEYPVKYPLQSGKPLISAINVSQWEGRELVTLARGDIITYAINDAPAVVKAENVHLAADQVSFDAVYDSGTTNFRFSVNLPIGGAFQVGNALAAIAAMLRYGIPAETIASALQTLPPVPGRFQAVPNKLGFSVIVDYAHTPDGIENLLRSAKQLDPKRILIVFGCGGNRDKTKRPIMGRLAATYADVVIVTSDNPRNEDPNAIITDILPGTREVNISEVQPVVHVEADRRRAIELAINSAQPGDMVLIAGKGHEDYQIVGNTLMPFDDRLVASEIMEAMQ